jgi:Flp pilus assembly protein TadG
MAPRQRGQALVEFSLTVGLLVFLALGAIEATLYLHKRTSLEFVANEGAFEASLAGRTDADGERAVRELWQRFEPGGGSLQVQVVRTGRVVVVTAAAPAPVGLLPTLIVPDIHVRAVHTIETFAPGHSPP